VAAAKVVEVRAVARVVM
jgi:hypothetical protein